MNREDIIRMALECGWTKEYLEIGDQRLERFAALIAAAERNSWPAEMEAMERQVNILTDALAQAKAEEREACAKVCDDFERAKWESVKDIAQNGGRLAFAGPMHCAAAIRARGEKK